MWFSNSCILSPKKGSSSLPAQTVAVLLIARGDEAYVVSYIRALIGANQLEQFTFIGGFHEPHVGHLVACSGQAVVAHVQSITKK
jgi:hypothetical protein